jgi:hypothetical protein
MIIVAMRASAREAASEPGCHTLRSQVEAVQDAVLGPFLRHGVDVRGPFLNSGRYALS